MTTISKEKIQELRKQHEQDDSNLCGGLSFLDWIDWQTILIPNFFWGEVFEDFSIKSYDDLTEEQKDAWSEFITTIRKK
ncbi:hypothetical protein [Porphyromonas gingivicanis]|uniref:hypothetical protein n=1 Tax=Porphyromonas gingivicanis TaxID=266762 RepID=UPI00046E9124|nr:hypothetical protein [Porphyromonas gingivicanis]